MDLLAFLGVSIVVIVSPGQDTALTIRNTLVGGRRGGVLTALGVSSGQAVWTLAAAVGVAALIVASEPAFVALKLAGAAYLVLLGVRALRDAVRPRVAPGPRIARPGVDPAVPADRMSAASSKPSAAFRQGLLSDLGNPKMAVFFTSLLPQFAPRGGGFLAMSGLGLLFCLLTFAWLALYASVVARASDLLRRPRVKRTLDALMGTALVGLGVRIAGQQRPG